MKEKKINVILHNPERLDEIYEKINDFRIEKLENKIRKLNIASEVFYKMKENVEQDKEVKAGY